MLGRGKKRAASRLNGAAWNSADQLVPVDEYERNLEAESFLVPVGALMPHPVIGLIAILLMAVAAEFTLLRAEGFAGPAVFFLLAAMLITLAIPHRKIGVYSLTSGAMLATVCWRLANHGNYLYVGFAVVLLGAFTVSLRGQRPYVVRTLLFTIESGWAGWQFFVALADSFRGTLVAPSHERTSRFYDYVLPAGVLVLFSIGVYAWTQSGGLPDSNGVDSFVESFRNAMNQFSLLRLGILVGVCWLTAGLLRPCLFRDSSARVLIDRDGDPFFTGMLSPIRNMLIAISIPVLCGCAYLWNRQTYQPVPPNMDLQLWAWKGFLMATGAAVIVTALTIYVYRGLLIADSRVVSLKFTGGLYALIALAGIGLACQRYRMLIDVNGANQTVAIQLAVLGVLAVGQCTCIAKIIFDLNTPWLIHRLGWAAVCGLFVFIVLPVDRWIHRHNVSCILDGNLRPVTQIAHSRLNDESLPELIRLRDFEQPVIREGAAAIVARRLPFIKSAAVASHGSNWTAVQWGVERDFLDIQQADVQELVPNDAAGELAHERLREYCRQWM